MSTYQFTPRANCDLDLTRAAECAALAGCKRIRRMWPRMWNTDSFMRRTSHWNGYNQPDTIRFCGDLAQATHALQLYGSETAFVESFSGFYI